MKETLIQTMFCCGFYGKKSFYYDWGTLSAQRKYSISKLVKSWNKDWEYYKNNGWECRKVTVTITPFK